MNHPELIADLRASRAEVRVRSEEHIPAVEAAARDNDAMASRSRATIERTIDALKRMSDDASGEAPNPLARPERE